MKDYMEQLLEEKFEVVQDIRRQIEKIEEDCKYDDPQKVHYIYFDLFDLSFEDVEQVVSEYCSQKHSLQRDKLNVATGAIGIKFAPKDI